MLGDRLKESEKDVFKLERKLEEAEKAFTSYQARAVQKRGAHERVLTWRYAHTQPCTDHGDAADWPHGKGDEESWRDTLGAATNFGGVNKQSKRPVELRRLSAACPLGAAANFGGVNKQSKRPIICC